MAMKAFVRRWIMPMKVLTMRRNTITRTLLPKYSMPKSTIERIKKGTSSSVLDAIDPRAKRQPKAKMMKITASTFIKLMIMKG